MTELLGLPFSPWSERARWALDARGVRYDFRRYQPVLGEPALRVKLRRARGRVTVPVLTTDDGEVLCDSTDIARWADAHGDGPALFPAGTESAIARFVDLSDRVLEAARALTLTRMLRDPEALVEMVPRAMRRVPGLGSRIGRFGIRRTLRKYGGHEVALEERQAAVTRGLDELRAALGRRGDEPARPLLGSFTYADITASQAVMGACPPPFGLKLGPASRRCWTDADVSARYGDLVAWRDALYERYRPRAPGL
jgi:glutathione S-transferase